MQSNYVIGIDEVGRGPLAGPVTVGVACVPDTFNWDLLPGVTDSKQLSVVRREEIFKMAQVLKREGVLHYAVASVSAFEIDARGIVPSIRKAMDRALRTIERQIGCDPKTTVVKLDGGLRAHGRFLIQETIIKGDQKEKSIGLASILAKVTRDRYMARVGQRAEYMHYEFGAHKGYGSKRHCEMIRTYGLSDMHRKSFCSKLIGS